MISVEHLTKRYGDFTAVSDLSFEIDEGHVYGFLGPNGAGKTTTMNIMTGCLSASEGNVKIDGFDIFGQPNSAKRLIGYLPEQPPLYVNESPQEYLRFVGRAKGLRGRELERQLTEVIEQTGIEQVCRKRISALSKGYRQRVGIAQALLGSPRVIILDEPTVGLDPIQIIEIRELIKQLGQRQTVIFSSHILSEVQTVCDRIMIINKGRLLAFGEPERLESELSADSELRLATDAAPELALEILSGVSLAGQPEASVREDGLTAVCVKAGREDIYDLSREVFRAFAASGSALLELTPKKASLEDIFLELTENEPEAPPEAGAEGEAGESPETERHEEPEPSENSEESEASE